MRCKPPDRFRQCLMISVLMHGALLGILAFAMTSPRKSIPAMRVFLVGDDAALVQGAPHPPGNVVTPRFAAQAAVAAAPRLPRIALEAPPSQRDAAPAEGSKGAQAPLIPEHLLVATAIAGENAVTDGAATAGAAVPARTAGESIRPEVGRGSQAPPMPERPLEAAAFARGNGGTDVMPTAFKAAPASPGQGTVLPSQAGSEPGSDMMLGEAGAPTFIHREAPQYPLLARQLGKEGRVVLRVVLDSRGNLENIEVVQSDGFEFAEAASTAIRKSTFAPAFKNGRRVPVNVIVPVRFVLN